MRSHRRPADRTNAPRPRRGIALVFVLLFSVAMAALAMGSIFMASSSTLLAKSFDRERDLKYAAEAALAIGKSRVNADPSVLALPVDTLYRTILDHVTLNGADGLPMRGITVNVYVGQTGSSSGQNGRFSSIVAEARDQRGNGFIRRLELTQESFAKFAYWTNDESNGSTTIFFNNGDELWGPVWSNDTIHIGSGGATFHDAVGTAGVVSGRPYGIFSRGVQEKQKPIVLPSTSALSKLPGYAAVAGWSFTSQDGPSADESKVLDRIEFVAVDLDGKDDSTSDNEGFFRYYKGKSGNEKAVRGDWPGTSTTPPATSVTTFCGDWHYMPKKNPADTAPKFYPASVHATRWFRQQAESAYVERGSWPSGYATANAAAKADSAATLGDILDNPRARCYLAGDPHLVAVDRPGDPLNLNHTDVRKGGEDSTFTAAGLYGTWTQYSATPLDTVKARRPWDAAYLFPVSRLLNPNARGVIAASGNIGVGGVVNGRLTLYAKGAVVLLDDLRYANDPVKGICHDILGVISEKDVVVADNALNDPPLTSSSKGIKKYFSMDDSKDMYVHGIMMSLGSSFRVQNYASGPTDVNDCDSVNNGRGCIFLSGGLIQQARGPVGTSTGTGYAKRYSYDHCAVVTPPPYFPTTGRFQDNRYIELDPAGFNPLAYFQSITPAP